MCILRYKLVILDGGFLCHYHRTVFIEVDRKFSRRCTIKNINSYENIVWTIENKYGTDGKNNYKCYDVFSSYFV